MISYGLFIIWFGLLCYQSYKWMFYKPDNFPPGPPRIPILGSYGLMLLLNYNHLYKAIAWLCKYYKTDVLGLYTGSYLTIVTHSYEATKECMNTQNFDGKPALNLALIREPEFKSRGIFFTDGALWHDQRRFMLRHLRDFGFGRRFEELELEINEELVQFVDFLRHGPKYDFEKKYHDGKKVLVPNVFSALVSNMFTKVMFNERLPREKLGVLFEAGEHAFLFAKKASLWGRLFSILDWVPKIFPNWSDYNLLRDSSMQYYHCIKAIVDEQYASFDKNHERHFLDKYFLELENSKEDPNSKFSYAQMVLIVADFYIPTLIANSTTFQSLLQRFYLQPEIFRRCQKEIDDVVGQSRLPKLDDRMNLPYVEATIRELMRHQSLTPDGLPHQALEDTEFRGYTIPKGTIVFGSIEGCNMDETIFNQPDVFQPERFLDKNGLFSPRLDKSLPFSAGKRLCAGETFARNTLFLLTTAIVQNFNIAMPKGDNMPLHTNTGFLRQLPDFWMELSPR